jgi:hypothetical protein
MPKKSARKRSAKPASKPARVAAVHPTLARLRQLKDREGYGFVQEIATATGTNYHHLIKWITGDIPFNPRLSAITALQRALDRYT